MSRLYFIKRFFRVFIHTGKRPPKSFIKGAIIIKNNNNMETKTYNELIAKREELMKQLIEVDNQLKAICRSIPTKTTVFGNYKLDKNLQITK